MHRIDPGMCTEMLVSKGKGGKATDWEVSLSDGAMATLFEV